MKDDEIILRIETFDPANGGGVGWYEDKGAYHLYLLETEVPVARLKPVGPRDEVRLGYRSHRRKWEGYRRHGRMRLPPQSGLRPHRKQQHILDLDLIKKVQSRD
jgi:hypothetical protein